MGDFLETVNFRRILQYLLYMFLTLVAQTMVLGQIRLFGVAPLVLPAVAVAMGMFTHPVSAALFCVIMGVFADMSFVENTVFFSMTLPCVAFAAAFMANFFVNRRFFAFMGMSLLGSLAVAGLQMITTGMADAWSADMITTVIIQTLWSMPAAVLAYFPPARWIK